MYNTSSVFSHSLQVFLEGTNWHLAATDNIKGFLVVHKYLKKKTYLHFHLQNFFYFTINNFVGPVHFTSDPQH